MPQLDPFADAEMNNHVAVVAMVPRTSVRLSSAPLLGQGDNRRSRRRSRALNGFSLRMVRQILAAAMSSLRSVSVQALIQPDFILRPVF